jgi:hypothetical protein
MENMPVSGTDPSIVLTEKKMVHKHKNPAHYMKTIRQDLIVMSQLKLGCRIFGQQGETSLHGKINLTSSAGMEHSFLQPARPDR